MDVFQTISNIIFNITTETMFPQVNSLIIAALEFIIIEIGAILSVYGQK